MSGEEPDLPAIAEPTPKGKTSLLAKLRIGALLVTAAVVLIIATLNWEPVPINLMGQEINVSLSLLVIVTFFCGIIIGFLLSRFRPWRRHD
ncbi:MAG TPA: hypothetical protein DCS85_06420 [Verrucomicrobiales bacterium]|nr:hypothetical protein [Deltaproteobacteria bacterium]HAT19774.1 hypothetical protein [Verrucomicrobiales bacterium]